MIDQSLYEDLPRRTFPAFFGLVLEILSDEEEAAVVAQRLVLNAYEARYAA